MLVHEIISGGVPFSTAIVDGTRRITYAEIKTAITNCRNRLYAEGVRQHDRVAIYSRNCAEFIYAYLGIVSLGAIAVPINFQLSMRETAYILKNAEIHHLFTYKQLDLNAAINLHDYEGGVTQIDVALAGTDSGAPEAPALPADFSDSELAAIIYTSGTTGAPKGAALSHRNLTSNADIYQRVIHNTSDDNILCVLPMYHCFAWTVSVMGPLYCGATIVILDSFTPKETISTIRDEKISVLVVVPSICSLLTKLATKEDMASVYQTIIGGTTLPLQVNKDYHDKFGLDIQEGYGLSECSPVVSVNPARKIKVGSIGPALPETNIKIILPDGSEAKVNEPGELLVQSPSVMHGYWKLPDATAETLKDGWLHTGDIARVDEDGYIFIVDRLKDMIISMGENIYPREIEELVYAFPGIKEAAVIGIEDKLRGQAGCCYFTVQEGETVSIRELKKYLQQNLALYKIPREFRQLSDLPKTSTGKIAKKELLKLYNLEKK